MKFGLTGVNAGPFCAPDLARALARAAEDAGFESLWTVEHVVIPAGYASTYPYADGGRLPGGEDVPIADPLMWMSFIAAETSRINLGTGILILPQRNPVVLAKEVATLDVLSGGRLLLGVGVGWLREEFEAIGVPFEDRGARTDEYVTALRALWTQAEPTHEGRFTKFERAKMYPKPARPIPIVIGGTTDAAARRTGRIGDGFFPWRAKPDELARLVAIVRETAKEHGRDPAAIEITVGGRPDPERIEAAGEAGADRYVFAPTAFDPDGLRRLLDDFASSVAPRFT